MNGITEAITAHDWIRGFIPVSNGCTASFHFYPGDDGSIHRTLKVIDDTLTADVEVWWSVKEKCWFGSWETWDRNNTEIIFDSGKVKFTENGILALERKDD